MNAPDFIIIGAMKSATSSLHMQLARQPGIFMSTPKEPNYFSDDEQYSRGDNWYLGLFSGAAKTDLRGESSTHYTKLPDYPNTIKRLKRWNNKCKFIYVMRHPVDRLISHYIHLWSEGELSCDINSALKRFPELVNYSCYAMQLTPYFKEFGQASVLPVFFDSIKSAPQVELERIANFLGYSGTMVWVTELGSENVSRERIRKFPGHSLLIDSYVVTRIRRALIPKDVRNFVKDKLKMKNRPTIDKQNQLYLEHIFNVDLNQLTGWFGTTVNCENFSNLELQKTISHNISRCNN